MLILNADVPVDEEGHGVCGDLYEGAEEEGPGDVPAQVGGVLRVPVVAHEPHNTEEGLDIESLMYRALRLIVSWLMVSIS